MPRLGASWRGSLTHQRIAAQPDDELAPETAKLVLEDWQSQGLMSLPAIQFHQPDELSFSMD